MPYISIIVPTLNESKYLGNLLTSIEKQNYHDYEVIVVDGGSVDKTIAISNAFGCHTIIIPNCKEYASRNIASEKASGEILLFTGADVIFPENILHNIACKFKNPKMLAVGGPGIPYDASLIFKIEFFLYNGMRCVFAHLPRPFKRFSTSTGLLAVRKESFFAVGGLDPEDINADGMLGRKLCNSGDVWFSYFKVKAYSSARRIKSMGGANFNMHFVYVLENFFPFLSNSTLLKSVKTKTGHNHSEMHKQQSYLQSSNKAESVFSETITLNINKPEKVLQTTKTNDLP